MYISAIHCVWSNLSVVTDLILYVQIQHCVKLIAYHHKLVTEVYYILLWIYTKLYEIWGSHDNLNEEYYVIGWGMSADLTAVWFFHWHQAHSWLDIWNNQSPVDGQCVTEGCACFLLTTLLHAYWWSLEHHFSAISPGIMNIEISACHWLIQ
jgi:hypothetical protein